MNITQKALIAVTLVAAFGIGIYEARRASYLEKETWALKLQQEPMLEQIRQLQRGRDEDTARLAAAPQKIGQSPRELSDLLKLRAEVARLKGDSQELSKLKATIKNDPSESIAKSWLTRVSQLKERLGRFPDQQIPELRILTEQDWLNAVKDINQLQSDADFSQAFRSLRNLAKSEFATTIQGALQNYAQANNGQGPADMSQLQPYLAVSGDDSVLQRYELTQPGTVTEKATALDDQDDKYYEIGMNTISSWSRDENTLQAAVSAFSAANNGQTPADPSQLQPYIKSPAEQAALQKLMQPTGH